MLLFILQHHSVVRMGHKINARQPADLFQLHWPLIPLCSVCKLCWFCSISQDDFESYFHPLICLQPHLSQHNTTVSFPLLYILPETDHKAVTKPHAYVSCNPTISVYALFILNPSRKKINKDTQLFVWLKKNKTKTNHIFTVRTGEKTQNSKTSDPLSHRDMHLWHVWKVCVLWKQSLPV